MNTKSIVILTSLLICAVATGQGKESFIQQQAYAEMQRVSGQVDVLQSNLADFQRRLSKLEGNGEASDLRQEINSLRATVAALRREMQSLRGEIVKDLSGRIAKMQTAVSAPLKPTEKKVVLGPHREYIVEKGDTLSLIAQAFGTTVSKIREMNNLKNDHLQIGQKLNVPK